MIFGVDLSAVQGAVNGARLAAQGRRFAYHRCGVGNDAPDDHFKTNVASLRAGGVLVGPYHFAYPLPEKPGHPGRAPRDQAALHHEAAFGVGETAGDLPPALDVEWPEPQDWIMWGCSASQIRAWLLEYLDQYTILSGVQPILYIDPWYAHVLCLDAQFAAYRLWAASYEPSPVTIPPWGSCVVWQNSGWDGKGKREGGIPGDGGGLLYDGRHVDTDIIQDEPTLQALLAR